MRLRPDPVVTPDDLERGKRALVKDAAWASLVGALYGGLILVPFVAQLAQLPAIALVERLRVRAARALARTEGQEISERVVIQQFASEAARRLDQLSPIDGLRAAVLFPFGRLSERRRRPRAQC